MSPPPSAPDIAHAQSTSPNGKSELHTPPTPAPDFEDNSGVPRLSLIRIFWLFLTKFGIFAWGGPVAQIALIKECLVINEKWITLPRFNRVFAVYQILPGPEAAELCMFFGCLAGGRLGGIAAGLGFILPGFILTMIASYLYVVVGFGNVFFDASFRNLWFISLGVYGFINMTLARRRFFVAAIIFILQYVGYALYVVFRGVPTPVSLALGIARTPDLIHLFILGLVAGSLSFGGAFTAIPFVQAEAVLLGRWLPQQVFIDCIAIGNVLPAPLVIFATFVGFQGGYVHSGIGYAFAGATVITLGMFFPCFVFTIAGHHVLERLVRNQFLAAFFDGICGAVVGVIAIVAMDILRASVGFQGNPKPTTIEGSLLIATQDALAAVLYVVSLAVLYKFTHKYTAIIIVLCGAVIGQFLFV
ncbi:chromate transporter [Rickenella mellea]|uniref:Chromate transporter n=1 Tax=Rickenella mellea TaxID=50990 RepID=A0A4Y7PU01_9AGAM|nr:chromate transporter [Rickenella mellea]